MQSQHAVEERFYLVAVDELPQGIRLNRALDHHRGDDLEDAAGRGAGRHGLHRPDHDQLDRLAINQLLDLVTPSSRQKVVCKAADGRRELVFTPPLEVVGHLRIKQLLGLGLGSRRGAGHVATVLEADSATRLGAAVTSREPATYATPPRHSLRQVQ